MGTGRSSIRHYRSGDEAALVALWNAAYASYAGYIPRSLQYWRWCILDRPGMSPHDVLILQDEHNQGGILGYGVLGQDGMYGVPDPNGVVLELAVDPTLSNLRREQVASRLIMVLEERSRTRGDEMIQFKLPSTDGSICRALRGAGYREEKGEELQVVIVDLAGLLTKILCHRVARIPKGWSPTFILETNPGRYRFCPHRRVRITLEPPVAVALNAMAGVADYRVDTDLSTLTELIFRRTTFEETIAAGRLAVHPGLGVGDVKMLVGLLALSSPWYMPHADGR